MKKTLIFLLFVLYILTACTKKTTTSEFISYRNLHEQNHEKYTFSTEKQWDSLKNRTAKNVTFKEGTVHKKYRTFGWHPYTNGTSYTNYNFNILWGVSYFSYALNPYNGHYKNIHQWKTTALVDSAKAHNCKVFLSVSNFGAHDNRVFLNNPKAQDNLINTLSELIAYRNADGINIDFEGVSGENRTQFTEFIIKIAKQFKKKNPKYMVSLCLYAKDWHDVFDIKKIDSFIDFYTLMGYDYYGSFSTYAGPVTPLKNSKDFGNGLESSVNYYLSKGVEKQKLIVGLPYYGAEWFTKQKSIPSISSKFVSHPPYKTIKSIYIDSLKAPVQFDAKSASTYITIKENSEYKEIWFEDSKSLALKYDWIKQKELSGVGIWALGYDDGYADLWNLLTDKFSK